MSTDCVRCGLRPEDHENDEQGHAWTDDGAPTGYEDETPAERAARKAQRAGTPPVLYGPTTAPLVVDVERAGYDTLRRDVVQILGTLGGDRDRVVCDQCTLHVIPEYWVAHLAGHARLDANDADAAELGRYVDARADVVKFLEDVAANTFDGAWRMRTDASALLARIRGAS